MVRGARQKVFLNKPITVGFSILDMSTGKLTMYQFYCDYLKVKCNEHCCLLRLFTDTNSMCCKIQTENLYEDMEESADLFDANNFEPTQPLYSKQNHRLLGEMKSKTGSTPPVEFVGLRAKMYSLSCGTKSQKKAKGIQKCFVKKHVQHDSFLRVLRNSTSTANAKFRAF